jgi:hypothetical protein
MSGLGIVNKCSEIHVHGHHSVSIQMKKWMIREVIKAEFQPVNMNWESGFLLQWLC